MATEETKITVWVTKYALTKGIFKVEGFLSESHNMVSVGWHEHYHGEGREWHRTEAAAKIRVKEMILKKKKSMEKSYAKLDKLLLLMEK